MDNKQLLEYALRIVAQTGIENVDLASELGKVLYNGQVTPQVTPQVAPQVAPQVQGGTQNIPQE